MIWTRRCKRCGRLYDQDVSHGLCPKCRKGEIKIGGKKKDDKRKL